MLALAALCSLRKAATSPFTSKLAAMALKLLKRHSNSPYRLVSVCLFLCLPCLLVCLFICLSVCLVICLFVCLVGCLFSLFICLFVGWLMCVFGCVCVGCCSFKLDFVALKVRQEDIHKKNTWGKSLQNPEFGQLRPEVRKLEKAVAVPRSFQEKFSREVRRSWTYLWRRKYHRSISKIYVSVIGGGQTCTFFTIPFANLRGNVMRTFLGKSDFYWPLMVLAEQWQCSLYALCPEFCSYYVPSILGKRTGYERTGPAFSDATVMEII